MPLEQIATQATGAIMGLALEKHNDKRQLEQQRKLQHLQVQGNREMMDYQKMKELEMWEATGYKGQKEQMMKAGLNPALMYGMGGGGGQTVGGSGGGVSGSHAPGGGGEVLAASGMGLQAGMMQAQIEVMKSQANLNNVEATKKEGVDTKEGETRIASLMQGITNAKQQEMMMKVETRLKEITEEIQRGTMNEQKEQIMWSVEKLMSEMEIASNEAFISKATRQDKIDIVEKELISAALRNTLTTAQTKATEAGTAATMQGIVKSEAEIKNMADQILLATRGMEVNEANQLLLEKRFKKELGEATFNKVMDVISAIRGGRAK